MDSLRTQTTFAVAQEAGKVTSVTLFAVLSRCLVFFLMRPFCLSSLSVCCLLDALIGFPITSLSLSQTKQFEARVKYLLGQEGKLRTQLQAAQEDALKTQVHHNTTDYGALATFCLSFLFRCLVLLSPLSSIASARLFLLGYFTVARYLFSV